MTTALEEAPPVTEEPLPTAKAVLRIAGPQGALIRPAAQIEELLKAHDEIVEVANRLLKEGRDYGTIPGTDRKNLLKPGAERMNFAFGVYPIYPILEREIDHDREIQWTKRKKDWYTAPNGRRQFNWTEESGSSRGLYRYVVNCQLLRRSDGAVVAEGVGSCSTLEGKFTDRPRELENTVLKMAEKRALIAATLNAYALSDRFTQDMEDHDNEQSVRRFAGAQPEGPGADEASPLLDVEPVLHEQPQSLQEWQEALRYELQRLAPDDPHEQTKLLLGNGTFIGKSGRRVAPEAISKMTLKWAQRVTRDLRSLRELEPFPETEEEAAKQEGLHLKGDAWEEPQPAAEKLGADGGPAEPQREMMKGRRGRPPKAQEFVNCRYCMNAVEPERAATRVCEACAQRERERQGQAAAEGRLV